MMNLQHKLLTAFPNATSESQLTDDFIMNNQHIMELESEVDYFAVVPSYMLWCLKNTDSDELVHLYTIHTLSEYSRAKASDNSYLNFMHRCNHQQRTVVIEFLKWCETELEQADLKQIRRAIKNWSNYR